VLNNFALIHYEYAWCSIVLRIKCLANKPQVYTTGAHDNVIVKDVIAALHP